MCCTLFHFQYYKYWTVSFPWNISFPLVYFVISEISLHIISVHYMSFGTEFFQCLFIISFFVMSHELYAFILDVFLFCSVCLTLVTSILSIGTMIGNLHLYGLHFKNDFPVPVCNLGILAGIITLAFLVGFFIRWKFPRAAPVLTLVSIISNLISLGQLPRS